MKSDSWLYRFLHNQALKRKLYVIIFESDTPAGKAFDVALIICILLSILLAIIESLQGLPSWLSTPFIVLEYLLRLSSLLNTSPVFTVRLNHRNTSSVFSVSSTCSLRYRSILPSFCPVRVTCLSSVLSASYGYSVSSSSLTSGLKANDCSPHSKKVVKDSRFFLFVVILVVAIGTLMYMIEGTQPNTQFNNIPNSIYWAIVTMTTVGYGDITPATALGKFLSACVMLIGYTIIAVPTGIVSVSMMKEYKKLKDLQCPNCHKTGHEENATYCKYCGHKLKNEETPQQESQTNGPRRTTS